MPWALSSTIWGVSPGHHRSGVAPQDVQQPVGLVVADLANPDPFSHLAVSSCTVADPGSLPDAHRAGGTSGRLRVMLLAVSFELLGREPTASQALGDHVRLAVRTVMTEEQAWPSR
jgi:hypothetical protein